MDDSMTLEQEREIRRIMQTALLKADVGKDAAKYLLEHEDKFEDALLGVFANLLGYAPMNLANPFRGAMLDVVNRFFSQSFSSNAMRILGSDFINPTVLASVAGLVYRDFQIRRLGINLPSKVNLVWLKQNGYTLVPGPPYEMSLLNICQIESRFFPDMEKCLRVESDDTFARNEHVACRWYALRKGIVPDSALKSWDKQVALLDDLEKAPTAVELVWGMICYKRVTGGFLLNDVNARTSSVVSNGRHVSVGCYDGNGFVFCTREDSEKYRSHGIASAREFGFDLV